MQKETRHNCNNTSLETYSVVNNRLQTTTNTEDRNRQNPSEVSWIHFMPASGAWGCWRRPLCSSCCPAGLMLMAQLELPTPSTDLERWLTPAGRGNELIVTEHEVRRTFRRVNNRKTAGMSLEHSTVPECLKHLSSYLCQRNSIPAWMTTGPHCD